MNLAMCQLKYICAIRNIIRRYLTLHVLPCSGSYFDSDFIRRRDEKFINFFLAFKNIKREL
jgi:hypothetical protein